MAVFVATTTLVREPQAPGARVTELSSTITSPNCGQRKAETMPTDAWHIFYEYTGWGALLRLLEKDCCVFCSYGSLRRPPIQNQGRGESCDK